MLKQSDIDLFEKEGHIFLAAIQQKRLYLGNSKLFFSKCRCNNMSYYSKFIKNNFGCYFLSKSKTWVQENGCGCRLNQDIKKIEILAAILENGVCIKN